MATTLDTLVARTRRFVRDYPVPVDTLTVSLSNSVTSVVIANTAQVAANWVLEVDYESILVRSITDGTTLSVLRGWEGTTAVSHASSSTVMIRRGYGNQEIVDAINSSFAEMYPYVYLPVLDTTLTGLASTYEFTVPNMPGTYGGDTIVMPAISRIDAKESGDFSYRPLNDWTVRRGATPKIQFRRPPSVGCTIRVHGFGPFPDLGASGDTVSTLFPKNAENALVLCAASRLLASGEAGRSRQDTGARDDREAAQKAGNAISLANQLERRFEKDLARVGMGPLPKHVVSAL